MAKVFEQRCVIGDGLGFFSKSPNSVEKGEEGKFCHADFWKWNMRFLPTCGISTNMFFLSFSWISGFEKENGSGSECAVEA